MNAHSPPTEQDHFEAARQYQEYYDNAVREVGIRIPAPRLGQTVNDYRRETLHALQKATLQNHKLGKIDFRDLKSDALQVYEPMALEASKTERKNPANIPPGEIKPIKVLDEFGRLRHTEFYGGLDPNGEQHSFVKDLTRPGRRVVAFMKVAAEAIQTYNSRREIA